MKKFILPVLFFGTVFYLISCSGLGTKLDFEGSSVFYKNGITEAEAKSLGDYLIKIKFFNSERQKSVQLDKDADTFLFKIVVGDGSEKGDDIAVVMEAMAIDLSFGVFENKPVNVHLCDGYFKTLRVIRASGKGYGTRIDFDEGVLYYTENIDKETATKLGAYLQKIQFFQGSQKGVQIDKNATNYIFRMVVKQDKLEDENTEFVVKALASSLSTGVFDSAAVDIHLCNDIFQVKKEILWQK
jgi:hypothetical protein